MRNLILLFIITLELMPLLPVRQAVEQKTQQQASTLSSNPDEARLITFDIDNFWAAYDKSSSGDKVNVFQQEYFDKGSPGLRAFTQLRIGNARNLVNTINENSRYYASIRQSTLRVAKMEDKIRASFRKLKSLYPDAVFPDVYFLIGKMNSGGTVTPKMLLIGAEMYGKTDNFPVSELSDWHKQVLRPIDDLPAIVAHELTHFEQRYPVMNSLLAKAIQEGGADFIGELISGKSINSHLKEYGRTHEPDLWEQFRKEMDKPDTSKWLYNSGTSNDRPADLGYYIGYRIVEAYYKRVANSEQAVKDILNIASFEQFLEASRYGEKFIR